MSALARAVGGLRDGEAVGVVGDADGAVERGGKVVDQRMAVEPGGIGVLDQAIGGADAAGNSGPNGPAPAGLPLQLVDERGHGGDAGAVVAAGRIDAQAGELVAGVVEGERFDLGAAEVDADAHAATWFRS